MRPTRPWQEVSPARRWSTVRRIDWASQYMRWEFIRQWPFATARTSQQGPSSNDLSLSFRTMFAFKLSIFLRWSAGLSLQLEWNCWKKFVFDIIFICFSFGFPVANVKTGNWFWTIKPGLSLWFTVCWIIYLGHLEWDSFWYNLYLTT